MPVPDFVRESLKKLVEEGKIDDRLANALLWMVDELEKRESETREVESGLKELIQIVREEMKADRESLVREIEALRNEMRTFQESILRGIESLRREMEVRFESIEARFRMLMWWIPLWFTLFSGFLIGLLKIIGALR